MRQGSEFESTKAWGRSTLAWAVTLSGLLLAVASLTLLVPSSGEEAYAATRAHEPGGLIGALLDLGGGFPFQQIPGDTTRKGGLSRRARALQRRQTTVDTTGAVQQTVSILDSIRSLPRDSSDRLAQFKHVRHALPYVDALRPKAHPMYASIPSLVRNVDELDSTGLRYHLRETVLGADVRVPLDLSLEDYLEVRMQRTIRQNWEAMAQAYELTGEKKKGLGELFGQVTKIEIPVPKNPLFSIFGPNIIRLQINGAVDIRGAFRNTTSDLFTASPFGQSRNEPDFSQEVQVNVKGEIGDKLKIDADWNTQRQFEYENHLKVRYTGYEDDIVQSVEAGNVSLPTQSSFLSSSQALFGIKAGFQLGPLKLTTVASQKKGQIRELTVSGGGRPTPFLKRATDYSHDHYFIDTSYIAWFDSAYLNIPAIVNARKEIRDIEVWVTRVGNEDPNERDVVAFIDEEKVRQVQGDQAARALDFAAVPGAVEVGRFIRLTQDLDFRYDKYAGYLTLNRSLQPEQAIAVTYSLPDPTDLRKTIDVGNFGSRDTSKSLKLVMKLVRPQRLGPQFKTAWRLLLKNFYPLGGRGIKKDGFELSIEYEIPGQEPRKEIRGIFNLIEVLGLDRFGEQPGSPPDGKFDYAPGLTIDEDRGELIFPYAEPFRQGIRRYFESKGTTVAEADSFVFNEVYDTTFVGASNSQRNKFLIKGTIVSSIASTYNLGFNIVEGSVEVIVDGQKATPNVDYTVDYISGQVVIKNQSMLVPGKSLQIRYEANDLFQLASKSLLGARGDLNLGKNTGLGFTIMNLNQQSLSDKVRLGEEPISNTIMGIDGGMNYDLGFLTRALNWLPGIQTNAMSTFSLRGEAAYMLPDPNTRKSTIAQDNQQGIAYIDDFEGARKTIPLGENFAGWHNSSVPDSISSLDTPRKLKPEEKIEYKGKMWWYNVTPSDVLIPEIWPNRSQRPGENQVTVLNLNFHPEERGAFNYSMDLDTKLRANRTKAWAGIQKLIGSTSTNLVDENVSFIELWVKIEKSQPTTELHIDLGIISEDVIPNGKLDTEDGLDGGIRNGILGPGEDVGLDGLTNEQERVRYADFIKKYREYTNDPSGDDWQTFLLGSVDPKDYAKVDGTEGNSNSELGRFPDTEDLNRNNVLDRTNSYFDYTIPIDTNNTKFRQYVTGGGPNQWYQIRIPINEYTHKIGDPSLTTVEGVRMWLTGAQDEVLIRIAEFNLLGNQWEELVKRDSTLRISVVNVEDNPDYRSPPGVERAKDRTRPDQNILLNEQSLAFVIKDLKDGQSRQAVKRYPVRPLDLFSYRALKMFVHGDERIGTRMNFIDTTYYDLEIFLRFGADSLNYYEYREPIRPGWDPLNEIVVAFDQITAIKLGRDSVGALSERVPVPGGPPGATYQVRGQPSLTNVRLITVGVENPANKGKSTVNGEVWINELRLTNVDDTPGWAYRFDTAVKLADVASISFNVTQRDPHFHALEDRFGTRNTDKNWALTAGIGLEKFLPTSWAGTTLNLTYTHVEQIQNPKYVPGTDVLVTEAVARTEEVRRSKGASESEATAAGNAIRDRTQTLSVTETFSLPTIKFNVPVDSWWITETINRMTLGYSFNKSSRRSPTTELSDQWAWSARFAYGLQFSPNTYFEPFSFLGDFFLFKPLKNLKVYYTPRGFNVATTFNRSQTKERSRDQSVPKPIVRNFTASRSLSFGWQFTEGGLLNLSTDYSLDAQSTLVDLEVDRAGRQRSFSEILGDIFGGDRLINFGTDQQYGQTISFTPRLVMPSILKLDKFLNLSARYSSRYDWVNNLQAGDLGKTVGTNGSLNVNLDFSLGALGNEIWPATPPLQAAQTDSAVQSKKSIWETVDALTRILIKAPIFDFDKLSITFTQSNRVQNSGVLGRPGFLNVFGRVPFFQSSLPENGPSLLYQLGLSSDPHGEVILKSKGSFPFFAGITEPGLRAKNGNLTDIFAQSNRISMRTSRRLWEGASLEINWNVGWSYNLNRTLTSDSLGVPHEQNRVVSGDVDRSYLAFPQFLFFSFFRTSIEEVNKQFQQLLIDKGDTRSPDAKLAQAFEEGLEALPIGKKFLGNIVPRPNWSLRWDGLEKFPLLSGIASRVSLDHAYTSGYKRRWKISPSGNEVTESQQITYGFSPLVGLNITFKELYHGSFGSTVRFATTTSLDLSPSVQNIVETSTDEMTLSANYSRRGFEIPFFGLSLSNDIDISFSYSFSKNSRKVFDMKANFKKDGTPLEGSSRTVLEPRIRYILSSRVTASVYYKYTKLKPDAGGSRIPGSTVNEGGLDVRVAIQP